MDWSAVKRPWHIIFAGGAVLVSVAALVIAVLGATVWDDNSPETKTAQPAAVAAPNATTDTTIFRGRFQCSDGRPLAGARVELWKWSYTWLPKIPPNTKMLAEGRADGNGGWSWTVSGGETNIFIRVVLVGENAAVRDFPWPWNWFADTPPNQNDVPVQDYRTQLVSGYQCGVWNGFSDAGREYREQTGDAPPQGATVVRAGAPTAGVPFTPYNEVWWPSGYPVYKQNGTSTAKHEFAHVFRHIFDGDAGHFAADAAYYWYLRNHSATSCTATNSGFAFNEGWAEYWAGEVMPFCPDANTGLNERNVAASLKKLEDSCRLSRARMVEVLAQVPERIHSIDEYTRALNCTPRPVKKLGKARPLKPFDLLLAEHRLLVVEGRRFVTALGTSVTRLTRETAAAKRFAQRPVPCPVRPCALQLERELRPVLLAGRLAQAQALRKRFKFLADPVAMRIFANVSLPRQLRRLEATRKAAVAESARIAARTLGQARRTAQRLGADRESLNLLTRAQATVGRPSGGALAGMAPIAPAPTRSVGPPPPPPPPPPPTTTAATTTAPTTTAPPPPPPPPAGEPDLVVDIIYLTVEAGWEWNIEVRNAGNADAPATRTGITQPNLNEMLIETPELKPGQSVTVKTQCPYGSLGDATARADSTKVVDESNEDNNERSVSSLGTSGRCRYP